MAEITTGNTLERFQRTLLPIYEEICGDARSYEEVAKAFDAFIDTPDNKALLGLSPSNSPMRANFMRNLFIMFLQKEENSGQGSFLSWAHNLAVASVHPLMPRDDAALAWRMMNAQYVKELHELLKMLTATPEPDRAEADFKRMVLIRARRASIMSAKIAFALEFKISSRADPVEAAILVSESGSLRDNFHDYTEQVLMNVPSAVNPVRRPQVNIQLASQMLQSSWVEWENPVQWVNNAFCRWFHGTAIGMEIVKVGTLPDAAFEDPELVRALIYMIIRVATHVSRDKVLPIKRRAIRMNIDWNESTNELVISATDLDQILNDEMWLKVKEMLIKMDVASKVRVYPSIRQPRSINIPLAVKGSPVSNPPEGMEGPTGRLDAGGRFRLSPANWAANAAAVQGASMLFGVLPIRPATIAPLPVYPSLTIA